MKLSLTVLSAGKMEGKEIPIRLAQFVIGRDPQCHLRPASPVISKRHCALLVRGEKAFVRDFDSTNGTFINGEPIKGEVEVRNGDRLKVGPVEFRINVEASPPVNKPTPAPPTRKPVTADDDDSIAAMLLSLQDDGTVSPGQPGDVPEGSTVMDMVAPKEGEDDPAKTKLDATKAPAKPAATGNTRDAAKAILEKYMRRPRA